MTTRMERFQRRWLPWLERPYGNIVHHCVVTMLVIPLCLAALGAITEYAVYKPAYNPNIYVQWMPTSAVAAVPFILIRVFWKWPAHLLKLEVLIHLIQTVGYGFGVSRFIIAGQQFYLSNRAIRSMLTTDESGVDLFTTITEERHVWNWLDHVVTTIFSEDEGRSVLARSLSDSRLVLISSIKVRQYRVVPVCCSSFFRMLLPMSNATKECYPRFDLDHESRETYGTLLAFPYVNQTSLSRTGYPINPYSNSINGIYGSYPLVGFLTLFPPQWTQESALLHLRDMRLSGWIDRRTRAIAVEVALTSIDEISSPVWAAASFLLERDALGRFIANQPSVHFNFFDSSGPDPSRLEGGQPLKSCNLTGDDMAKEDEESQEATCIVEKPSTQLTGLFVSIVPIMIYTAYLTIRGLLANWKLYLQQPFNWSLFVWAALLVTVLAFTIGLDSQDECGRGYFYNQTKLVPGNSSDFLVTDIAAYTEYLPIATTRTNIRRLLAVSVFVHIFNSLRFLVRLKSLGVLVRTLHFSYSSLLSFSLSFTVIFFGFVFLFYMVFSLDVEGFRDLPSTILTLWLGMLGEVQITSELYRSRDLTITLYIFFTFISVFVLLTMIISIVSNAYDRVQKEAYAKAASVDEPETENEYDSDDEAATPPGARSATLTNRRQTHINTDFSQLVSEVDVLSSTVQKWKRGTTRLRSSRISPTTKDDIPIIKLHESGTSATNLTGTDSKSSSSDTSLGRQAENIETTTPL